MKKWTWLSGLFFLAMSWTVLFSQVVMAADTKQEEDIASELQDKTFFIVELARGHAAEKDYYGYFKKSGVLEIKFNPKHSKSGKWQVDKKGNLCITTLRHKKNESIDQTRCGKFVKTGKTAYRWYDDSGQIRANFSLRGKGNRLP